MTFHECDRCNIKIKGRVNNVMVERNNFSPPKRDAPQDENIRFELCDECVAELQQFQKGCSITESYRQGPRGSTRIRE